jgi:hypothetical protein
VERKKEELPPPLRRRSVVVCYDGGDEAIKVLWAVAAKQTTYYYFFSAAADGRWYLEIHFIHSFRDRFKVCVIGYHNNRLLSASRLSSIQEDNNREELILI